MIRCSYLKKNTISTVEEGGGACTGNDGSGATMGKKQYGKEKAKAETTKKVTGQVRMRQFLKYLLGQTESTVSESMRGNKQFRMTQVSWENDYTTLQIGQKRKKFRGNKEDHGLGYRLL